MSNLPADLKYTKTHEWVRDNGDGTVTVGITDHAQESLGDIVFVELPEVGTQVFAGKAFAVVESVKAVSEIFTPVAGEIVEVNDGLNDSPEVVNSDPYGEAWFVKIKMNNPGEADKMLTAAEYEEYLSENE